MLKKICRRSIPRFSTRKRASFQALAPKVDRLMGAAPRETLRRTLSPAFASLAIFRVQNTRTARSAPVLTGCLEARENFSSSGQTRRFWVSGRQNFGRPSASGRFLGKVLCFMKVFSIRRFFIAECKGSICLFSSELSSRRGERWRVHLL